MFSHLNSALAHGHVALLGLLDLSIAFDTVDHDVLLKRLEISDVVMCVPLQCLKSYLAGWVQTIVINRCRSSAVKFSYGVPQGSLLCPILFVLYTKDVSAIIRHHGLLSHCDADDTQVYFYCKPDEVDSLAKKCAACSDELCTWMRSNRLKLNANKTELFGWQRGSDGRRLQHQIW